MKEMFDQSGWMSILPIGEKGKGTSIPSGKINER